MVPARRRRTVLLRSLTGASGALLSKVESIPMPQTPPNHTYSPSEIQEKLRSAAETLRLLPESHRPAGIQCLLGSVCASSEHAEDAENGYLRRFLTPEEIDEMLLVGKWYAKLSQSGNCRDRKMRTQLLYGRACNMSWKKLCARFGYGRTQLTAYYNKYIHQMTQIANDA